jgi:hypothetical protein
MPEKKSYDVFVSYSTFDKSIVTQVVEDLKLQGRLKPYVADDDLPIGDYIGGGITEGLRSSTGAVFFLSPAAADSKWVRQEIELARTLYADGQLKFIIPVLLRKIDPEKVDWMMMSLKALDFSEKNLAADNVLDDLSAQLIDGIRSHLPQRGENVVDVPFVVIAMTCCEAEELLRGAVTPVSPARFAELTTRLAEKSYSVERLISFYGKKRDDWRSPLCQVEEGELVTIKKFIEGVVQRINDSACRMSSDYIIDPQFRSEDLTNADKNVRIKAREELEDRCVLVIDSLSLFHPTVSKFLNDSPLAKSTKNVIPIAVPPPYYLPAEPIEELLESAMKEMLESSYYRFENGDSMCEFGFTHPRALKRWLFATLPEAARKFSRPVAREENRANLRRGNWSYGPPRERL